MWSTNNSYGEWLVPSLYLHLQVDVHTYCKAGYKISLLNTGIRNFAALADCYYVQQFGTDSGLLHGIQNVMEYGMH